MELYVCAQPIYMRDFLWQKSEKNNNMRYIVYKSTKNAIIMEKYK